MIMEHMYGNIPYMFDCWADPVVHLFLLKSSMVVPYRAESKKPIFLYDLKCLMCLHLPRQVGASLHDLDELRLPIYSLPCANWLRASNDALKLLPNLLIALFCSNRSKKQTCMAANEGNNIIVFLCPLNWGAFSATRKHRQMSLKVAQKWFH